METETEKQDAKGNPIIVGQKARILVIPDWLTHDLQNDEVTQLKKCEDTVMKVTEIDPYGYVWFGYYDEGQWFCLKPEEIEMI